MAQKVRVDDAAYKKLKKDLNDGTLGRLYVLHGEETYLRQFYLERMKEKLVGGGMGEFNLHTLSARDFTPQLLEQTVDILPMMSQRTMILIFDYDLFRTGEKEREELIRIFSQLPEYCCVVFVYGLISYRADARTRLAAALKEYGSVVEFARQEQGDLVDWVCRRFRALDKQIDTELAQYLIFRCGDLMNGLIGEIEKVGSYAEGQRITRKDIDAVATAQLDAVVFQMTDAVGAGDFDRAATVLGELLEMREPGPRILYIIGRQMRQLYCARLIMETHGSAEDLAEQWGLKSYAARKIMDSARRFSLVWCRRAVIRCAQTDLEMKSGGGSERDLLTNLLLELATPVKRRN